MMLQKMLGKVFSYTFSGVIKVFITLFPLSHIVIQRKPDLKDKNPTLPSPKPVIVFFPFLVRLNSSWILFIDLPSSPYTVCFIL